MGPRKNISSVFEKRGTGADVKETFSEALPGELIFTLDLGSFKIRGLAGFLNQSGAFEINAVSEASATGIQDGFINDASQTVNAVKAVINDLFLFTGKKADAAFISICGSQFEHYSFKTTISRGKAAEKITRSEGKRRAVILDSENRKNIFSVLKDAGLQSAVFFPAYSAAASAVLEKNEIKEGVVLTDIGASGIELGIFKDGAIRYSTFIPIGGKLITMDIKNSFDLTFSEAELLKIKSGSAYSDLIKNNEIAALPGNHSKEISLKALAQIIQARAEEMLEWIMVEIENSGVGELTGGLVLTGGGSLLKDFSDLAKIITGMPVRMGFPIIKIANTLHHDLLSQENATRIGLLMKSFEKQAEAGIK